MSVKRYKESEWEDVGVFESEDGKYVLHEDYALLETRVKELTDERDELKRHLETLTKETLAGVVKETESAIMVQNVQLKAERDRYKNLYEALQQTTKEVLLRGEQERDRLEKAYGILKLEMEFWLLAIEPYPKNLLEIALTRAEAARKGE